MAIIAYIRVSSDKQNCENQHFEIKNYCKAHHMRVDKWVEEVISSRKDLKNRKLAKILYRLKSGDVLITTEISRLGRNILEIMNILQTCLNKNCQIITLKENYHLGQDLQSKVLAFAFGLSAEIERQLISQRTKEALARVKASGKHLGRPFGFTYRKLDKKKFTIMKLWMNKMPKTQIAQNIGCSWSTLNRFMKENLI